MKKLHAVSLIVVAVFAVVAFTSPKRASELPRHSGAAGWWRHYR